MRNLKKEVFAANIYLWKNHLVYGTQGNVSGIDREKGIVYIKPSGVPYEELKEEMIVGVDMEGNVIEGNLKPSVDTIHHLFLYRNIPEVRGICHTHSLFITVFSVLLMNIPVLTTAQADVFGKEIPVTPYVDNTEDLIGKTLLHTYHTTGSRAIILGKHGLFTLGENPQKASFYALMSEYCAEVAYHAYILSRATGKNIEPLPPEEIRKWFERYHSSRYGQRRGNQNSP